MESVVATVSGYQGSERFNLIKLIDRSGASYVGNMNQSVTHLVCWRFEGKKYEFAMKFGIRVVNHCWIEECVKKGRRVSEEPYTYRSGEDMGPLVLEANFQSKDTKNAKRPLVDTQLEDKDFAAGKDSILLDEDLFPKKRQNDHGSSKSIGKAIKRTLRKDCPSSSRHGSEKLLVEIEEASTSLPAYSCRREKRNSAVPESLSKGHRLAKRHMSVITLDEEDSEEVQVLPKNESCRLLVNNSEVEKRRFTSNMVHTYNIGSCFNGLEKTDVHKTVQQIVHLDDDDIEEIDHENQNLDASPAPSSTATSEKLHEAANSDSSTKEDPLLAASPELSCVICWTDFSSTRGVLPCGHRFCFTCIQDWAGHMNSQRKPSTCPLCKASFICITKVDDATDQKIYSQSMPIDTLKTNVYVLRDETRTHPAIRAPPVCYRCLSREPEDLLVSCSFCSVRCVHTYCLDPPLFPWTCVLCKDLQMLYNYNR